MQQNCNVYKGLFVCPTQILKITWKHTKTIHKTPKKTFKHEWSWQTNKTNKLGPKVKTKINYLRTWLNKKSHKIQHLHKGKKGKY